MKITHEIIDFNSDMEWLNHRKLDVTSTEVSALFGASPYLTSYELFHRKIGSLNTDNFVVNDRVRWGNRLESAIAYGVAEDLGLIVMPFKSYGRIPQLRMGSSFDFKIVGLAPDYSGDQSARDMFREHGAGVMEVKNVDGLQFRRTWADEGNGIEAPAHIEFQVQHQLEVADMGWSLIAPLVGGNTPVPIIRVRDHAAGDAIKLAVAEFWNRVEHLTPPAPEYTQDADTIAKLYVDNDGSTLDLSGDPRVYALCKAYKNAGAEAKAAEDRKKGHKAELLTIIKAAKSVSATGFKISAGTNKQSFRSYDREAGERVSITISQIPAKKIEATVEPFRNIRITEVQ